MIEEGGALLLIQDRAAGVAGLERREPRAAAQQQRGAAVGKDMGDLHPLQQGIDRDMDEARARAGERQQAGQPVLGQPARHPLPLAEAPRLQRPSERADRRFEPIIIERSLARDQSRRAGLAAQREMVERMRGRIGRLQLYSCLNADMIGRVRKGIKRDG
jgi:hypothetical protein